MRALPRTAVTFAAAAGLVATSLLTAPPAAADTAPTNITSVSGAAKATGYPTLVGLRWGAHDTFDRVVFEFRGGTPAYKVGYGTLRGLGTGEAIPLAGNADLVVDFDFARAHDDNYRSTYSLRTRDPLLTTLRQIKWGGDFEGQLRAGLGLRDIVGFRVFTLTSPARVVVDMAHRNAFSTAAVTAAGDGEAWTGAVRAARHPGWDRLVLDVKAAKHPDLTVRYATDSSVLLVKLVGVKVSEHDGADYTAFGLPAVRAVRLAYDSGATLIFRVSTPRRGGFKVTRLTSPNRIVVDVKH